MGWLPIAESEIGFDFQPTDDAQVEGSVVSHAGANNSGWALQVFAGATIRLTAQSFTGGMGGDSFEWDAGSQGNTAPNPDIGWEPSPFTAELGADDAISFQPAPSEADRNFGFLIEVQVADPAPGCTELGRVSKANVSAYDRMRVHSVRLYPTEKRCLVANFNGAIGAGRTIQSATWQTEGNWSTSLSGGAISANGRETQVMLTAHRGGRTTIQCTVSLDNGETYNQLFVAEIGWTPFQVNTPSPAGQQTIVINAT